MGEILLGLAGRAGVGKSTAAALLAARGLVVINFADPIRDMLYAVMDWGQAHFDGPQKEIVDPRYGCSPREAVQTLGDWGRDRMPNFWIALADELYRELRETCIGEADGWWGAVLADVRTEEEAAWVRENGGHVVHVLRSDVEAVREHATEGGVRYQPGDFNLSNDGTVEELERRVDGVLMGMGVGRGRG